MILEKRKIKLLLVEDHELFRESLKSVLELYTNIKVISEAANGKQLFKILPELSPDIILLDIEMPKMNGIETLNELNKHYSSIKTIILTGHYGNFYANDFFLNGARAYLSKSCSIKEIIKAINTVHLEGYYMNESISDFIISSQMQKMKLNSTFKQLALTEREVDVLKLICDGYSNKQIAAILKIELSTINFHKKNLYLKTKLKSLGPLVKYAIRNGYSTIN